MKNPTSNAGPVPAQTLSVAIRCNAARVYDFVSNPENLPQWAPAFCLSVKRLDGHWLIETPQGPLKLQFAPKNDLGVLDHYITPPSGAEIFVPMRVVPNESGSEMLFTLFQRPGMSYEDYRSDLELVERDLATLKQVLETE
ncbi:MAG TPA: SRPBCC family protein [Verrucomicrobiae bacterium]|nr:SRPBCC family protein [Verrucomicrobiae bacterium]